MDQIARILLNARVIQHCKLCRHFQTLKINQYFVITELVICF